jgi:hypothetical protein
MVVKTMHSEGLSYGEAARRFGITGHHRASRSYKQNIRANNNIQTPPKQGIKYKRKAKI